LSVQDKKFHPKVRSVSTGGQRRFPSLGDEVVYNYGYGGKKGKGFLFGRYTEARNSAPPPAIGKIDSLSSVCFEMSS